MTKTASKPDGEHHRSMCLYCNGCKIASNKSRSLGHQADNMRCSVHNFGLPHKQETGQDEVWQEVLQLAAQVERLKLLLKSRCSYLCLKAIKIRDLEQGTVLIPDSCWRIIPSAHVHGEFKFENSAKNIKWRLRTYLLCLVRTAYVSHFTLRTAAVKYIIAAKWN